VSSLFGSIVGPVVPNRPKVDKVPVPYRLTVKQPQTLKVEGSQSSEPREAVRPISENPTKTLSPLGVSNGLSKQRN